MHNIRYVLDEHLSPAIAAGLRRGGIEAITAVEAGLRQQPDEAYLDYSLRLGCVLLTFDADFLRLHYVGVPHAGIAYFPGNAEAIGYIISR